MNDASFMQALISSNSLVFMVTFVLSLRFAHFSLLPRILDYPNVRSLHGCPILRTGGLALSAGILVGMIWNLVETANPPYRTLAFLFAGWVPLAMASFLDYRMGIAAKWHTLIHLFAAISLLTVGLRAIASQLRRAFCFEVVYQRLSGNPRKFWLSGISRYQ